MGCAGRLTAGGEAQKEQRASQLCRPPRRPENSRQNYMVGHKPCRPKYHPPTQLGYSNTISLPFLHSNMAEPTFITQFHAVLCFPIPPCHGSLTLSNLQFKKSCCLGVPSASTCLMNVNPQLTLKPATPPPTPAWILTDLIYFYFLLPL